MKVAFVATLLLAAVAIAAARQCSHSDVRSFSFAFCFSSSVPLSPHFSIEHA
jgi:hypothetical protein